MRIAGIGHEVDAEGGRSPDAAKELQSSGAIRTSLPGGQKYLLTPASYDEIVRVNLLRIHGMLNCYPYC